MKYYAVTEDPRELYHYGVKGMKWGQHLFGEDLRPKSPAYKRAVSKLKAGLTNKIKSFKSISNARSAQREINKRAKEQNNYMKSVMKTQKRLNMLDNLSKLDQEKAAYKQFNNIQKINTRDDKYAKKFEQINAKAAVAKTKQDYEQAKKSLKAEKHMNKLLQEAREGRLHYGQLSEEQISRVQNRLNMEEQARKLGGKEKPSWRQQKKEARRAGVLKGITAGTSAAMEEVARAGAIYGINHILDRQKLKSAAKQEGKENKAKQRAQNKKTGKEIREDAKQQLKQDLYETEIKSGQTFLQRLDTVGMTTSEKAKKLQKLKEENREKERLIAAQDKLADRTDSAWDTFMKDHGEQLHDSDREALNAAKTSKESTKIKNDIMTRITGEVKAQDRKRQEKALENYQNDREERQKIQDANDAEDRRYELESREYQKLLKDYNDASAAKKSAKKAMRDAADELKEAEAQLNYYNGRDVPAVVQSRVNDARKRYESSRKDYNKTKKNMPNKPIEPEKPKHQAYKETSYDLSTYNALRDLGLNPYGGGNNSGNGKKPKKK